MRRLRRVKFFGSALLECLVLELFAVAAVIIGGASLSGGKGRIMASVIGVILLKVLENGLNLSGVEPFYRYIAVGLILIVAVVIDQLFPDLF